MSTVHICNKRINYASLHYEITGHFPEMLMNSMDPFVYVALLCEVLDVAYCVEIRTRINSPKVFRVFVFLYK